MKTSPRGIDLIKEYEGFRAKPYYCPAGKLTVGYGHVVKSGEHFDEISEEQGEAILRNDLATAESAANLLVKVPLNQNEFDALVSLIFNIGTTNFRNSTLLKLINKDMRYMAAQEFSKWVYSKKKKLPGLVKRRDAEKLLFLVKEKA